MEYHLSNKSLPSRLYRIDYPDPVPFISLFSDREHAENWRLKQPWHGKATCLPRSDWVLYVIDTNRLHDACFFRLKDLVEGLGLKLPDKADQHIGGTYLCLHNIPPAAIVERIDPEQVQYDRDDRLTTKRVKAEKWDYLDSYNSSEREALQENWNTIIEKNLEDN
ncbi:hypothetical protein BDV23DRAFT_171855 [Aspergillus alliaceus]|uniref:DUF7587 domain-containing protein n=1 Tax=Petromyces alliaceus TaxID=209559 RepID=A0A5N7CBY1_PETAA|nr:hypothetical protein BDV23DRAFT_171855 [Aspergillus alliaceus]